MAQLYFHSVGSERRMPDHAGTPVADPCDAYAIAVIAVRRLLATGCDEDWRGWRMLVVDEDDELLFELPFATVLGPLH